MVVENNYEGVYSPDDIDITIIKLLQKNSKTQYRELAKQTEKSLGTIANRIQRLEREENKIIKGWTIQVDPEKLGFDLTVIIQIQIEVKYLDIINEELQKIIELGQIYNVTGDFDIMAIGHFQNRKHLDDTIHRIINIDHIVRTSSNVALRTLKQDYRVPLK